MRKGHFSLWQSATIHGALVVYSKPGNTRPYSFPDFHSDIPIIFGEWWKKNLKETLLEYTESGNKIMNSDAFMINGTAKIVVEAGKTYLLAMGKTLYFGIAKHKLTIIAMDERPMTVPISKMGYVKLRINQSIDCILEADQQSDYYYMAAREYVTNGLIMQYDNTTTTAILKYQGNYVPSSNPFLPNSYYDDKNPNGNSKMNNSNALLIFVSLGLALCCAYYLACFRWRTSGTVDPLA